MQNMLTMDVSWYRSCNTQNATDSSASNQRMRRCHILPKGIIARDTVSKRACSNKYLKQSGATGVNQELRHFEPRG